MADTTRGMLWELLYRASLHSAPAHPPVTACLLETLKLVLAGPCEPPIQLYRSIAGKTDIMAYRPALRPGLVCQPMESLREGGSYVVKNPDEQRYLKLSKEDYFIYSHFDGIMTVRELLTLYFMEFQALGHERVKGLIGELRSEHFLVEKPVTLFTHLKKKLQKKTLSSSMHTLAGIFFNRQLSVRGLDTTLSWLYKRIIWVFFSAPLVWIYPVLSAAGIALFLSLLFGGHYSLFKTAHSYSLGLVTLALIGIARITLHEGAHAFAVKACGREVHRGGFLFYFGVPSFFADTSDIWLGSKKERIMVSWAGPYAEIILSALLTLLIVAMPSSPANDLLFKIAFIGFLSAFLNLNPLLELDGYFILIDWLDLPRLRKRSLAFIKDSLLLKLKKSEPFSEEHKIFTLYGILSSLWTVIAVALSLVLLKMRMLTTLPSFTR